MREDKREQTKPQPSKGQVWRFSDPSGTCATRETVFGLPSHGAGSARTMTEDPRWQCIGIETPAGRVMVGEDRTPPKNPDHVYTVLAVLDGTVLGSGRVMMGKVGQSYDLPASAVALWPLLTPVADTVRIPDFADHIREAYAERDLACAAREQRRREISAVLAEDSAHPRAAARARAVYAAEERHETPAKAACAILAALDTFDRFTAKGYAHRRAADEARDVYIDGHPWCIEQWEEALRSYAPDVAAVAPSPAPVRYAGREPEAWALP